MTLAQREKIRAEVEALEAKSHVELKVQYKQLTGDLSPKRISYTLLKLAVAYEIQRQDHKALVTRVHKKLEKLAKADNLSKEVRAPNRSMKAGGRLIREWHGKIYEVYIADEGVYMEGKHYSSLSSVAYAITGARWNGPRFFGLRSSRTQKSSVS